jgi:hypothetical protein
LPPQTATHSPEPRLSLADWRHAERLFHVRRESVVPVDQPLALISQIQRSGGHLLAALLDGHPQLHCHPAETQIGHPTKADWPVLDLAAGPDAWLGCLREPWVARMFERGYGRRFLSRPLPMTIVPSFLDNLFRVLVASDPPSTQRAVIDRYFTAFFNAWIDVQGLYDGPKRWVTGFCPRLAWGESRQRWAADYPDGRLLALLRDPRAWYASARSHKQRYLEVDEAIPLWRQGVEAIEAAKRESPRRVFVITYESLVAEPESAMRATAEWLGIDWTPSLLVPTFNRRPIPANSSFGGSDVGVRTASLDRWKEVLEDSDRRFIEQNALPIYEEARTIADRA